MASPEEVSAWSLEEIQAEIQTMISPTSALQVVLLQEGYWQVRVLNPEGGVDLEEAHTDKRLALLNAFGVLWLKNLPQPGSASPWVRRREIPRPVVQRSIDVKDPEDLDPADVEMVYRRKP